MPLPDADPVDDQVEVVGEALVYLRGILDEVLLAVELDPGEALPVELVEEPPDLSGRTARVYFGVGSAF